MLSMLAFGSSLRAHCDHHLPSDFLHPQGFQHVPNISLKGKQHTMEIYKVIPSLCQAASLARSGAARKDVLAHEGVFGRSTQLALFVKLLDTTSRRIVSVYGRPCWECLILSARVLTTAYICP
jgi:hypothetical protein